MHHMQMATEVITPWLNHCFSFHSELFIAWSIWWAWMLHYTH